MGSVPYSFGGRPAPGGIGREWTEFRWNEAYQRQVCWKYRRFLDKAAVRAGFVLSSDMALGQLEDDPPGWMTSCAWQMGEIARILKTPFKEHVRGTRFPLWFLAAVWWALENYHGFGKFMGWSRSCARQWRSDAFTRTVLRRVKPLLKRTQRYAWMAEVGLTHRIGSGGPRDIAAILLKVAMMEGHQ